MKTPCLLVLLLSPWGSPVYAQPGSVGTAPNAPASPASASAPQKASDDTAKMEDLLMLKPTSYRPTLSRDPFAAPSDGVLESKGDVVDDISVKGRIVVGGKNLAVVSDSRGNARWLPVGYKFRDGEIVAINEKSVTFHQWELNSTSRVFRTVVKPFKREEGKR